MKKTIPIIMCLTVVALSSCNLFSGNDSEWPDLTGTSVSMVGSLRDTEEDHLNEGMDTIEAATGVTVTYQPRSDLTESLRLAEAAGDMPDIGLVPQPGVAREFWSYDMNDWLGADSLTAQYDAALLELSDVNGSQIGVWYRLSVKSLVWYNKTVFASQNYQIPTTWDDMITLSNTMVADGYVPWSIGAESGSATGWPLTDWLEDIMLRMNSPATYDAWVAGNLAFDSPEVNAAVDKMEQIMFNADFVLGGRQGIVDTSFSDAMTKIVPSGAGGTPEALMHRQASFTPAFLPTGEPGTEIGVFYLPPIDSAYGFPYLGGGDLAVPFADRQEVRTIMEYFATADSVRPAVEAGNSFSPHGETPSEWYPAYYRDVVNQFQDPTTFRFDASDLMPSVVGTGSFWSEITDFVDPSTATTQSEFLSAIDETWP